MSSVLAIKNQSFNPLTPNDPYRGRTAPLTSKRCILYNYSTNIGTEYFKHGIYSPFFHLQNAVCFIILTYLVPVLFTFYIQDVLKLKKKIIPAPKVQSGSFKTSNRKRSLLFTTFDSYPENCGFLTSVTFFEASTGSSLSSSTSLLTDLSFCHWHYI